MMLDTEIKKQLAEYLQLLENDVLIKISAGSDSISKDMTALIDELTALSPRIKTEQVKLPRTPSFTINRMEEDFGVTFAGIPLGHEFTSLVLALLQVSGRAPKVDGKLIDQVKSIKGEYHFETYISLSCHNCPEVVQALNLMSILNPGITHTMIDGAAFKEEAESKNIMAVPTVLLNGEFFGSGRMTLEEILGKLGSGPDMSEFEKKEPYDILVIGGGPAGASAAIYAARKGIRTGIVAERFGGQVRETLGIENLISVGYTEGPRLAEILEQHVSNYDVDIMSAQRARRLERKELIEVELENGAVLKSKAVILSTGARWRNVGIPGEEEFKNKGVAYCPHCDGPLYKGKQVAVIGGGNSGIEAAIDLAGIASHVTVFEFMPELKADAILQKRLYSLPNVTVLKNVQTKEITGTDKVNGITYMERESGAVHHMDLQGVFVQIGLIANTDWLGDTIERNRIGEIIVDNHNATSLPGVFAAGDCTDSVYKQIVISMGSGASAALSAFDYLIRN
ncbi:alkyl hydroperoxide reductase subunit F [Lacrimispora sphenoides]|uniref:Alkyl hydroperoxide reductase subunit F n=1 Tax=Lacrimispora sphenoides JCM 1415 TaxID=1297793 RepID=A0ABY1CC55_9FIRM|nr:alkyl hydroperoxide reductase subunit F [Lacrimispora sphenoides]SET90771.1 alkyl hydroperoxide reductase subunit F [[Clostridium] sphenoides JCM 1415]SUY52250.1 alkyl hydroperoxide reductase [Lacrimispora sphenoides]